MTEHELLAPANEPINVQHINKDDNDDREYLCPVSIVLWVLFNHLCTSTPRKCMTSPCAAGICFSIHDGAHRNQQVRTHWKLKNILLDFDLMLFGIFFAICSPIVGKILCLAFVLVLYDNSTRYVLSGPDRDLRRSRHPLPGVYLLVAAVKKLW